MPKPLIALLAICTLAAAQPAYAQGYGAPTQPAQSQASGPSARLAPVEKKNGPPTSVLLPAVPGRGIRDVPNIAIKYYDVSGKNIAEISKSIEQQRKDPVTQQVRPGGAGYGLGASVNKKTADGKCTVVGAQIKFTPTAELPRLVNEQALAPDQLAMWRAYLSQIEVPAAAGLWFIQDRIPALEKSLIGKECDVAVKLGSDGLAKLREDVAAFNRQLMAGYAAQAAPKN